MYMRINDMMLFAKQGFVTKLWKLSRGLREEVKISFHIDLTSLPIVVDLSCFNQALEAYIVSYRLNSVYS